MKFPLGYDATVTRADFVRMLPVATGQADIRENGDVFSGDGWQVSVKPLTALSIGLFRLERHRIEISFDGLTAEQQDAFMQRFTICYQRGGG